jgi:hydroxymethylbilane synthase
LRRLRIATRASELALAQSARVARLLEERLGAATELVAMTTRGDRLLGASLASVGGKGLFVKELEQALLDGRADLAVHSAKDLPAAVPPGLALVAFPERADPRDALVARERGAGLAGLRAGARVGTGSVRRAAQIRALRPDLAIVPLRGNVPTRLRKLEAEALDAIVLACAGLDRLGLSERIDERIDAGVLLPAVAQGALAIETLAGGSLARELATLDDAATSCAVRAERAFLAALGGDCNVPLAGFAETCAPAALSLRGLVSDTEGRRIARAERRGAETAPEALGAEVAEALRASGGREILAGLQDVPRR